MKRIVLGLPIVCLLAACETGWDSEYKDMYHKACVDESSWVKTEADKERYCDCVLEKTMAKYPTVADALENMDKIGSDSSIQDCKAGVATQ